MDVSGQSMLPMAAIIALLLPGHHLKALLIPVVLVGAVVLVMRIASRKARSQAYESVHTAPVKPWSYRGRRRAH